MVTRQDHTSSLYVTCTDIRQQNYMNQISLGWHPVTWSYAVELSDGLEIKTLIWDFEKILKISDDNELLDRKQDNEFVHDRDMLFISCSTESIDMNKEESLQSILITVFLFGEVWNV